MSATTTRNALFDTVSIEGHRPHKDGLSDVRDGASADIHEAARQPDVPGVLEASPAQQPRRVALSAPGSRRILLAEQTHTNYQSKQKNSNQAKVSKGRTDAGSNPRKPEEHPPRRPPIQHRQENELTPSCQFEAFNANRSAPPSPPHNAKSASLYCLEPPRGQARKVRRWPSIQSHNTRILEEDCSVLNFDDSAEGNLTRDGEELIPEVVDVTSLQAIYKAVRMGEKMAKTAGTMSRFTSDELYDFFCFTSIRILELDCDEPIDEALNALEKADTYSAIEKATGAYSKYTKDFDALDEMMLVQEGIYLDINYKVFKIIDAKIVQVKRYFPHHESSHRRLFWEKFFFLESSREPAKEGEMPKVFLLSEQRVQTVASIKRGRVVKGSEEKSRLASSPTSFYSRGAVCYYPAIISDLAGRNSAIGTASFPKVFLKCSNAYIWLDLGYAVEAPDMLRNYKSNLDRLSQLPVNRLFWNQNRPSDQQLFHFLNYLMIEIKPLPESEGSFDALMRQAVCYLVLNASVCLHDYLKLLWLGASRYSKGFSSELPVIYLIAAVGFKAKVLCLHIRKFNSEDGQRSSIRYEAVEMDTFDLTTEKGHKGFCRLYNSIQALAYYYANLHRTAMINAMESSRAIEFTQLPELFFVQSENGGNLLIQMVSQDGCVQYEGSEDMVDEALTKEAKKSKLTFDESFHGLLPKPDEEDKRSSEGEEEEEGFGGGEEDVHASEGKDDEESISGGDEDIVHTGRTGGLLLQFKGSLHDLQSKSDEEDYHLGGGGEDGGGPVELIAKPIKRVPENQAGTSPPATKGRGIRRRPQLLEAPNQRRSTRLAGKNCSSDTLK